MILSNQVRCNLCGEEPFSSNRWDYVSCKCGNVSVDGGMSYFRRSFRGPEWTDMSIEIPDEAGKAAIEAIKWAEETRRNELGILCAVARALRDNGVKIDTVRDVQEVSRPQTAFYEGLVRLL